MKTKKLLSMTVILIMLVSIFLSGCGQNTNDGDILGRANAKEIDINAKIGGRVVELLVEDIQDPTDNWVDFKLPETALANYDLEQEVKVEGGDGKTILTGKIKDISSKAEFATRRATSERGDASDIISYNVKVQLDANAVRPGMRFKLLGDASK